MWLTQNGYTSSPEQVISSWLQARCSKANCTVVSWHYFVLTVHVHFQQLSVLETYFSCSWCLVPPQFDKKISQQEGILSWQQCAAVSLHYSLEHCIFSPHIYLKKMPVVEPYKWETASKVRQKMHNKRAFCYWWKQVIEHKLLWC